MDKNVQLHLTIEFYENIYGTVFVSGPENRKPQFAEVCGRNIKRLNNPAIATSQERSPAALCFYSKPFNSGQSLTLKCTPQTYQTTLIGR